MLWNMFDFASYGRNEGDTAGRNDKGMVTFDRQTRKDAFYWYKANWSGSPFTYITDRRYTNRTLPTTDIKVYSTSSSVQLLVNGVSLGKKTSTNRIFLWSGVSLQQGNNTVQALGTLHGNTYSDQVNWSYIPNLRISAGARKPYTDLQSKFYDFDHYYSGGKDGVTSATIAGTPDQSLYQTYRYGTFSYTLPLVNGVYSLYLKFMEPTATSAGQRVFSVSAQGTTIVSNEDIYRDVGQNTALERVFSLSEHWNAQSQLYPISRRCNHLWFCSAKTVGVWLTEKANNTSVQQECSEPTAEFLIGTKIGERMWFSPHVM